MDCTVCTRSQGINHNLYVIKTSFKFGFKGLYSVRLSDVSREVILEEVGTIGKDPVASRLLFNSRDGQDAFFQPRLEQKV